MKLSSWKRGLWIFIHRALYTIRMKLVNEQVNLINKLLMCRFIIFAMTTTIIMSKYKTERRKKKHKHWNHLADLYISHNVFTLYLQFYFLEFYLQMCACCLWISRSRDRIKLITYESCWMVGMSWAIRICIFFSCYFYIANKLCALVWAIWIYCILSTSLKPLKIFLSEFLLKFNH